MHCLVDTGREGNAGDTEKEAGLPLESSTYVWKMKINACFMNGKSMFNQ